jgi:hypothetical protein
VGEVFLAGLVLTIIAIAVIGAVSLATHIAFETFGYEFGKYTIAAVALTGFFWSIEAAIARGIYLLLT